jgi:hypothetical protein
MPVDFPSNLEVEKKIGLGPEQKKDLRPEVLPLPERPVLESGDTLESGRWSNQAERLPGQENTPFIGQALPLSKTDEYYFQIEKILEENLGDFFAKMTFGEQQKFKQRGEQITLEILQLTSRPHFRVRRVINLIKSWLRLIPGVNRFFLEQTAKIKADKIVATASRRQSRWH